MTRFGLAITCAVAIGVFLVAALLLREDHLTPEKLEKRLEIYRTRGWLSRPRSIAEGARAQQIEDTYLTNCLHKLGTLRNDARSIRINEPIDEHRINIFFIGSDPNGWFGDFRGNCAYTGHKNIIICDLEFFERVRSVPDWYGDVAKKLGPLLVSDTMLELSRSTLGILALWLIGHEIGHIAYGDASAHFDFHRPSKPIAFPETLSEKEKRCDAFAVLAANETLRDHLQFGLYEVIGYELGQLKWETGQT